jgi:methionyl-tRNA formyltransferase
MTTPASGETRFLSSPASNDPPSQARRGHVAVVFAYHNVGVRCLRVLRAHGVEVPLVVTHRDDPAETHWFARVADAAEDLRLPWIAPDDVNAPDVVARVEAIAPDFVFSFYCRRMLQPSLLSLASRGALNMHGSLLPKYRGRAPVNWAVLHGERHTGATLHYMAEKPDAGDIVAQQAVPILPDDTAREVFDKVTLAAEICLDAVMPALLAGTAPRLPNDIAHGSYFGGRRPEDGRIDWRQNARRIHDLVRAVAPPYPGALTHVGVADARILRTRVRDVDAPPASPTLVVETSAPSAAIIARCGGGGSLLVDELELDGTIMTPDALRERFGPGPIPLG